MENIDGFLAGDKCMYIGQFLELLTERFERVNLEVKWLIIIH